MCGRFTQKSERKIIAEEFYVQKFLEEPVVNYNVSPSQNAGIIIRDENINVYDRYKWGLIPSWSKNSIIGNKMINARAETLMTKASFKGPFFNRRCIVPVDGFFEWHKNGKNKIPYYIFQRNRKPFALAGLWDKWISPEGDLVRSFTIITIDSSDPIKEIHQRMPVIISKENYNFWLDTSKKGLDYISKLKYILYEVDVNKLKFYQVSNFVNSPANNGPECIYPLKV